MPIKDDTGRMHADKGQSNGGQFVSKNYVTVKEDKNGNQIFIAGSDATKLSLKCSNGTTKEIYNASNINPFAITEKDDINKKFDKLITMPLLIKNMDKILTPFKDAGYESVFEGFGNPRDDENRGIDYRIVMYNKEKDKIMQFNIDFKFIKQDEHNIGDYNNTYIPLHLFRDSDKPGEEAQFLSKRHKNNVYLFLALDTGGMSFKELLNAKMRGRDISDNIFGMKTKWFSTRQLKQSVFDLAGSEEKLRQAALEQREKFRHGLIPSEFKVTDNIAKQGFKTPGKQPFYISTTRYDNGKISTQITLFPKTVDKIPGSKHLEFDDREIIY